MKLALSPARGFSLIELMVAMTIGLMIVAAMLANLAVSSQSSRTNARVSEFQTNGRFAACRGSIHHRGNAMSRNESKPIVDPNAAADAASAVARTGPSARGPVDSGAGVRSSTLLLGRDAITIEHNGRLYQLRQTRQGKLILTK